MPGVVDTPQLIKICNGKVRRLVNRIVLTFEQAAERRVDCDKSLIKLLGVLALLRELRALDYKLKDVPPWETFVPIAERERLLKHSLMYLYGRDHRFLSKIDTGGHKEGWDELSKLHGLLLWLAHDCGADLTAVKVFNESPDEKKRRINNLSYMLLVTPDAVADPESLNEAAVSIERTTPRHKLPQCKEWVTAHTILGQKLFQVRQQAHLIQKKINWQPRPGWVGFVRGETSPTLHLILRSDEAVELADVSSENCRKVFPNKQIASFKFPRLA